MRHPVHRWRKPPGIVWHLRIRDFVWLRDIGNKFLDLGGRQIHPLASAFGHYRHKLLTHALRSPLGPQVLSGNRGATDQAHSPSSIHSPFYGGTPCAVCDFEAHSLRGWIENGPDPDLLAFLLAEPKAAD